MSEWVEKGIHGAVTCAFGWACVVVSTLVVGFCTGYWIGHRRIMGADQTLIAFLWLPFLWLGFPQVFIGYAVTGLAWYLPMRHDSRWLRISAASANFVVWAVIVFSVVEQTMGAKFFQF